MSADKEYLGDSVYIDHDGYHIILTTENDDSGPSNRINLEPCLVPLIGQYLERMRTKYATPIKNDLLGCPLTSADKSA